RRTERGTEEERDERKRGRLATQQIPPYNLGYGSAGRYSRAPVRVWSRRRRARLQRGTAREPPPRGRGHVGDRIRSPQSGRPPGRPAASGRRPAPMGPLDSHGQRGAIRRRSRDRRQRGDPGEPSAGGVARGGAGPSDGGGGVAMMPGAFAAIPDVVLGPLAGRPEAHWHRAPPGKWTPAQIVQHLAISIDGSGRAFEQRRAKPPMRRRPRPVRQRLAQFVYLDIGWIPSGRPAPAATEPAERPDAG